MLSGMLLARSGQLVSFVPGSSLNDQGSSNSATGISMGDCWPPTGESCPSHTSSSVSLCTTLYVSMALPHRITMSDSLGYHVVDMN